LERAFQLRSIGQSKNPSAHLGFFGGPGSHPTIWPGAPLLGALEIYDAS